MLFEFRAASKQIKAKGLLATMKTDFLVRVERGVFECAALLVEKIIIGAGIALLRDADRVPDGS